MDLNYFLRRISFLAVVALTTLLPLSLTYASGTPDVVVLLSLDGN